VLVKMEVKKAVRTANVAIQRAAGPNILIDAVDVLMAVEPQN
jgi:hypothetical protein